MNRPHTQRGDADLLVLLALVIGAVLFLTWAIRAAIRDEREWAAFKTAHKCLVVAETDGTVSSGFGVSAKGQIVSVVTTTAGKTAWKCDDGVTYWRSN